MELVDSSIVNVAFSHMAGNLGATIDEITWVAVGYILAAVIVLPMTGWLGARFGRKRYFLTSVAIFTVASVLCGLATSLESLVVWRIVQGLGGGALIATSQAILFESFPADEKATGVGALRHRHDGRPGARARRSAASSSSATRGRGSFSSTCRSVSCAFCSSGFYRADPPQTSPLGSIDVAGFALLALGIGALQFVLERGEHYDWFDSQPHHRRWRRPRRHRRR